MTDTPIVLTHRLENEKAGNFLILPLSAEERSRLRGRRLTKCGREVILQLPREGCLRPGDVLSGEGQYQNVLVEAALETLLVVSAKSSLDLLKAAYHLGNRHVALELHEGELFLIEDEVLAQMLRIRGLTVKKTIRSFYPETGAYDQLHRHLNQ